MSDIEARFRINWPGFCLDVGLTLPGSGITALFGHSGSGKTTLLRCMAGLERASEGKLVVDGDIWQDGNYWLPTHKRPIGYVFQEASLFPHLSVMNNLLYGQRRIGKKQKSGLDQAINLLGIEPLLNRDPSRLSGGERQRVGIARALSLNPQILLMDEPLAALDIKRKQEILPYLERLHHELDIPVIYVSHSPVEVIRLADYLVILENGKVNAQGPLADILTRMDAPVKLGDDYSTILEAIVSHVEPEWHLVRVNFDGGSLWLQESSLLNGNSVRVQILASDVSLAITEPGVSSIQNVLRGSVKEVIDDGSPGSILVRIVVGEMMLFSRITRRAFQNLDIRSGMDIWAQIKTVALIK
ncbi:TPA: molybdenum ABC transporter ATP-binding protein [Citrobacter freundii]|nr:molybdenum ABC transporter ATP-binding protein [Citrobacter freundii]HED3344013.1 molybdenum ABC transporter ATP-binding protein [Citrobacter freundii]HED4195372.1 molybdenum ABC transporter ATP-binding protein [Citrobacter freundii]